MLERARGVGRIARFVMRRARLKPTSKRSVAEYFEHHAVVRPERPFVRYGDRCVSYGEFNVAANRVAHWAIGSGLRTGDVVGLLMENRPEFLETWAGLSKLGVTTALVNTNLSGGALRHALLTANASRIIVGGECLPNWATLGGDAPPGLHVYVASERGEAERLELFPDGAEDFGRLVAGSLTANPDPEVRASLRTGDDLFYIYTSGTTGRPKAARFSHLRFFEGMGLSVLAGYRPSDVVYCALPLYHSAGGVIVVAGALISGASVALTRKFSAGRFWDDVRRYDATAFQYIGEFCRYLLNQPPSERDGEHRIRVAVGNGLRPDIWERFQQRFQIPRILEFYGATEGNAAMANLDNKVGSIGKLPPRFLSRQEIIRYDVERDEHLRDERGRCIRCETGETGELIGQMPRSRDQARGRFEGYTSKEATERKILRDVFEEDDRWFRTGDLIRQDADGYCYFVDRIGDTFRWKGENVSTQEVAEYLSAFPGVEMVNVYGVIAKGMDGRAGMAALVLRDPERFDGAAFYAFAGDVLPSYAQPVFVRIQSEADLTGTFKLKKLELQREGFDPAMVRDPLFVRDDRAQRYVRLTSELFSGIEAGQVRL